ncbi:unnamed protein product [Rangifer tarandus platyrhynchus]|uniref:Uncharacterized protein n=1 Tax=Rangifer tarandus platyrhynchus TaxID=3082113 RepID=A0ABN9A7A0_RANTA|nr:unnamed protein product [Rangifer tarandus platyrhynchus]
MTLGRAGARGSAPGPPRRPPQAAGAWAEAGARPGVPAARPPAARLSPAPRRAAPAMFTAAAAAVPCGQEMSGGRPARAPPPRAAGRSRDGHVNAEAAVQPPGAARRPAEIVSEVCLCRSPRQAAVARPPRSPSRAEKHRPPAPVRRPAPGRAPPEPAVAPWLAPPQLPEHLASEGAKVPGPLPRGASARTGSAEGTQPQQWGAQVDAWKS